jgi:hypothetical protein
VSPLLTRQFKRKRYRKTIAILLITSIYKCVYFIFKQLSKPEINISVNIIDPNILHKNCLVLVLNYTSPWHSSVWVLRHIRTTSCHQQPVISDRPQCRLYHTVFADFCGAIILIWCKNYKRMKNRTRWFKYDRDKLWLVYTQIIPVMFEPPCI